MQKIALIYDRVTVTHGGAEQVLLALQTIYPQATLFTSVYDAKKAGWAKKFKVITSFIQRIPYANRMHRSLALLMPFAFESLDLSDYDIIISVTSAEAKGVITKREQLHFCYLLSPPRYLYHYQAAYLQKSPFLRLPIIKQFAQASLGYLRAWDQQAIFRPDKVVPIAAIVKKRAKTNYPTISLEKVIYPPINTDLLSYRKPNPKSGNFYLLVARLVPYKHVDAAILACQQLGSKLVIVGDGPDYGYLRNIARRDVIFRRTLSNQELATLYATCRAVLSPGLDDFGISALEANLFGKAVIINQLAGAAEIIVHGKHGLHMPYQEGDAPETIAQNLVSSMQTLSKLRVTPKQLEQNARKYGTNKFARTFDQAVQAAYRAKEEGIL